MTLLSGGGGDGEWCDICSRPTNSDTSCDTGSHVCFCSGFVGTKNGCSVVTRTPASFHGDQSVELQLPGLSHDALWPKKTFSH